MERSRCSSSGCQSGWTLYILDHSDAGGGDHRQWQCYSPPCENHDLVDDLPSADEADEDDSMLSDASSGPPPRLRHDDDDEEEDQVARRQQQLIRHRNRLLGCHAAGSSGGSRSVDCFGSPSHGHGLAEVKRRAVVGEDDNVAAVGHPEHNSGGISDDDLDDTASSSAVSSLQPSGAFSARHLHQWSSAVQGASIMQDGYAMLHRN